MAEVCYLSWHHKAHEAEISHQTLHPPLANVSFHGRDGKKLILLLMLLLWEGFYTSFCSNCTSWDFLNTGPVSLPRIELLRAYKVIRFSWKGQEEPFEGL